MERLPMMLSIWQTLAFLNYVQETHKSTDIHGTVTSKAYLEVVVQQVTDFVDSTDIATTDMASISTINQTFGRKFKIVSFKWINESDL